MNYGEFVNAVEKGMNIALGEEIKVTPYTAVKNNGKRKSGILVEEPGINISPTIYLEEYFERYQCGSPLECIVDEVLGFYYSIKKEKSWDYKELLSYTGVEKRVVFKLINTEKNKELLSRIPHKEILDLSIVFYVLVEMNEEGTATMLVTNEHTKQWGVDVEELWDGAVKNAGRLLPPECFTMEYALDELLGRGSTGTAGGERENILKQGVVKQDHMYILTNQIRSYGAASILYPHVLEMVAGLMHEDYFILPSSVHEVILVPESVSLIYSEMLSMVKEVNETQVDEEEILSNNVYFYHAKTGTLLPGGVAEVM